MAFLTFDWRSIKRWALLFTFVMLAWMLYPVARCSVAAFEDTPLSEARPHEQSGVQPEQAARRPGFFSKLGGGIKTCWRTTPVFGENGKTYLLVGLAALTVLAYAIAYWDAGRRKSFEDR